MPQTAASLLRGIFGEAATRFAEAGPGRVSFGNWINGQLLVGPLSLIWCALLLIAMPRPAWRSPRVQFSIALAASSAMAIVLAGESNLGYARNWDLIALLTAPAAIASVMILADASVPVASPRVVSPLVVAGLLHTVPWLFTNANEEATLRRFAQLPLTRGQAESTLGFWYALRGDPVSAESRLRRALARDDRNIRARLSLGRLLYERGDYRSSFEQYEAAARTRGDLTSALAGLALAAHALGRSAMAESLILETAHVIEARDGASLVLAALIAMNPNGTPMSAGRDSLRTWNASNARHSANTSDSRAYPLPPADSTGAHALLVHLRDR
jgi:tetratricopeptide (TPR) repeat protein